MPRVAPRNAEEIAVGDVLLMAGSDRVLRVTLIEFQGASQTAGLKFHLQCEREGSIAELVCQQGTPLLILLPDLKNLPELNEEACADERRRWMMVKGKHPGQPGHDAGAWAEWTDAARRVQALGVRLAVARGHGRLRRSPPLC
jgi:hypothetical protein